MLTDAEILQAVAGLRDEWPSLLGDDDATLERWLAEMPRDDPEAARQTVNRILDLFGAHPQAKTRLGSELGIKGDLYRALRGYEPLPVGEEEIPPGTWVVCPVDPGHYRVRLRQKGQRCPDHGRLLVRADSIPSQE